MTHIWWDAEEEDRKPSSSISAFLTVLVLSACMRRLRALSVYVTVCVCVFLSEKPLWPPQATRSHLSNHQCLLRRRVRKHYGHSLLKKRRPAGYETRLSGEPQQSHQDEENAGHHLRVAGTHTHTHTENHKRSNNYMSGDMSCLGVWVTHTTRRLLPQILGLKILHAGWIIGCISKQIWTFIIKTNWDKFLKCLQLEYRAGHFCICIQE